VESIQPWVVRRPFHVLLNVLQVLDFAGRDPLRCARHREEFKHEPELVDRAYAGNPGVAAGSRHA
jgi:hypothetical protein